MSSHVPLADIERRACVNETGVRSTFGVNRSGQALMYAKRTLAMVEMGENSKRHRSYANCRIYYRA